jgi:hypothetical protein
MVSPFSERPLSGKAEKRRELPHDGRKFRDLLRAPGYPCDADGVGRWASRCSSMRDRSSPNPMPTSSARGIEFKRGGIEFKHGVCRKEAAEVLELYARRKGIVYKG